MNQRLKDLIDELKRQRKILNQAELAQLAGISRTQFSELVTGKRKISDKAVHKITSSFSNINKEWLLTGEGEMFINASYCPDSSPAVLADDHSTAIAGDKNVVNADHTIAMLVAEVAAQRRLTEKVLEQNSELLAMVAVKVKKAEEM